SVSGPSAVAPVQDPLLRVKLDYDARIDTVLRGKDGTLFIGGNTNQTFETRAKTDSAFVGQLSPSGELLWADLTDSTPYSSVFKPVTDKDGNLIAAGSSGGLGGKALAAKYQLTGTRFSRVWSSTFGGVARDVATDRDGNVYVVGGALGETRYSKSLVTR